LNDCSYKIFVLLLGDVQEMVFWTKKIPFRGGISKIAPSGRVLKNLVISF
jgi:hypothetical protein